MRVRLPLGNRVVWGAAIIFLLAAVWQFKFKPQYRPVYEQGVSEYRHGQYVIALNHLQRAYSIDPNAVDVVMMMGWTHFKLQHLEEAGYYFRRALQLQPSNREARIGAAFVAMHTGKAPVIAPAALRTALERHGSDPDLEILLAQELAQAGRYAEALPYFEGLRNSSYGAEARDAVQRMLGLQGFDDPVAGLTPVERPAQLQFNSRAAEGSMWSRSGTSWQRFYVQGVDLGPGVPGHTPGEPPQDGSTYLQWLRATDQLGANVVRVYTLLPPAFYRAFGHHAEAGSELKLYQQIWVGEPATGNLYDPAFVQDCRREIRYVIDALHGHGEVPARIARGSGLYTVDLAPHIGAILFGRELEPSLVIRTNELNPHKTSYDGRFLRIAQGSPAEVWAVEMLDYVVAYENDTYNWQHPVALVNWPPLDPLAHPTESTVAEEIKYRQAHGEPLAPPAQLPDDDDAVAIDEAKFQVKPVFEAGLFASYHVYPYYPDFLLLDPKYLRARDRSGFSPMFGYLQDLRARIPHPLVISEFGIPSSIGISHFHPYGFHHGGLSEEQQAEIVARLARDIREAGCAGGIAFELFDEWYKHNWLVGDFEGLEERRSLWLNELDPEKRYGLIGFRTRKWNLFAGDRAGWQHERTIYSASAQNQGELRGLQVAADEAFLYLRLSVKCPDCGIGRPAGTPLRSAYAIAINTLPSQAGIAKLPFANLTLSSGADFLLILDGPSSSKLLVANNYNPYEIRPRPGTTSETTISYRSSLAPELQRQGSFGDFIVETNRPRFGRDGRFFPGQRYSRSPLRYGSGNPKARDYDSRAEWYVDRHGAILVRLPWGKLLVTDPSRHAVFFGFQGPARVRTTVSPGFEFSVFALRTNGKRDDQRRWTVADAFPSARGAALDTSTSRFLWPGWERAPRTSYFKKAFYALQQTFLADSRTEDRDLAGDRRAHGGMALEPDGATER